MIYVYEEAVIVNTIMQNILLYILKLLHRSEAYSELCQTPKMKHFAKIVNAFSAGGDSIK